MNVKVVPYHHPFPVMVNDRPATGAAAYHPSDDSFFFFFQVWGRTHRSYIVNLWIFVCIFEKQHRTGKDQRPEVNP